jgi:anti-anti-sigma factor
MSGDVDMVTVPELREQLNLAVSGGCADIVLDLEEVDYVDSSALGLLVWLDRMLVPKGGRLVLAGANRDVSRILELSGLAAVAKSVGMSSTVAGALEGLELPEQSSQPIWTRQVERTLDPEGLGEMREAICSILQPLGFPEAALFDVRVAIGEALANAIRHGSPDSEKGTVRVVVTAYPDRAVIEVMDSGAGFDGVPAREVDVYDAGGRGVMFMRALMDLVEFERSPLGGTLVRLTKHRVGGAA